MPDYERILAGTTSDEPESGPEPVAEPSSEEHNVQKKTVTGSDEVQAAGDMLAEGRPAPKIDPDDLEFWGDEYAGLDFGTENRYPEWVEPMAEVNRLMRIIAGHASETARAFLLDPMDRMDLKGFKGCLRGLRDTARAIARAKEALQYIRPVNVKLAAEMEASLEPGKLERKDARVHFVQLMRFAWGVRKTQLGGLYESEIRAKDPFLL